MMSVIRTWKVYGYDGHRQRESFSPSYSIDCTKYRKGLRRITVMNADMTGTHDYSLVRIEADTREACAKELDGQISDGIFENSRIGTVEEVI